MAPGDLKQILLLCCVIGMSVKVHMNVLGSELGCMGPASA